MGPIFLEQRQLSSRTSGGVSQGVPHLKARTEAIDEAVAKKGPASIRPRESIFEWCRRNIREILDIWQTADDVSLPFIGSSRPNIWSNAHDQARKHLKVTYRNAMGRRANPEAVPFTLFTVQM